MQVYLDNAATTALDEAVLEAMLPFMRQHYGNPSSIHQFGRITRTAIEKARKEVAQYIGAAPAQVFFTSGGTEANNMALRMSVAFRGIKNIISSPIEHHAVLHTAEELHRQGLIELHLLEVNEKGEISLAQLESLLLAHPNSLVSLMHANNEIGTRIDLASVAALCKEYGALFHSDTVQTLGHYPFQLNTVPVDFINCAAHKFHGPKGVGFIYVKEPHLIHPFITGGAQERNMRGGTENLYGIIGLAKAMEVAHAHMSHHQQYIQGLKKLFIQLLQEAVPGVAFNGDISDNALYTVLNVSFPENDLGDMFLFNLDIKGIAASGGSACSSGSDIGSHVLRAIKVNPRRNHVRFSFCKYNTEAELHYTIHCLKALFKLETA